MVHLPAMKLLASGAEWMVFHVSAGQRKSMLFKDNSAVTFPTQTKREATYKHTLSFI